MTQENNTIPGNRFAIQLSFCDWVQLSIVECKTTRWVIIEEYRSQAVLIELTTTSGAVALFIAVVDDLGSR